MPTPIQPDKLARAAGFDPFDFSEAVHNGEDEYAGVPIGSWRQNGGEYLNVPDDYANQLGFDTEPTRSNSSESRLPLDQNQSESGLAETGQTGTTWPEAARDAGPPVSANLGASHAVASMADAVEENPEIAETIADVAAFLGSGGLGLAATEEGEDYRAAKVGGVAAVGFGFYKLVRHITQQQDRQKDMEERQQRHEIQQDHQRQMENTSQNRLNGGKSHNRNGSAVEVG